uniref:FA complementation group E n=1 Tax=Neogobius melanostomus TaxID=47308 RepID=A0A8C6U3V6_9GOBI
STKTADLWLLLRALLSGVHGAHRALEVFHKQHRANPNKPLQNFIETLCQDEVTCPVMAMAHETKLLLKRPMVCLFPALFKQNLLTFIHQLHHLLPQTTLLHVLECIKRDSLPNTWVTSLTTQLEREVDIDHEEPLFSAKCGQRLTDLSQRLYSDRKAAGWASCFQATPSHSALESAGSILSQVLPHRKRKNSPIEQDSDSEEVSQQKKRTRVELCDDEDVSIELSQREGPSGAEAWPSSETQPPSPYLPHDILPETIKVRTHEWDQNSTDVVKVLNDCGPAQVEMVCRILDLPNLPEHILPKLCSSILELSPDLSFSTATALIKSLLLEKVLSLSEPASRCLVTTVTSLCSRYPRPMCHALFETVLKDKNIGERLDFNKKMSLLRMTFKIQWTEPVLSIIHRLLDSKLDVNEDLFTQFTKQLMNQAPQCTKSVKFAKMLLTVLTKYSSIVTAAHKHTLSNCLMLNETFLKKSLQAALKRITQS